MKGAVRDWLSLAAKEAERRGVEFEKDPFTSRATFLVDDNKVAGKVRESLEQERDHPRIWLEYDDERTYMENAHPNSRIITVVLDIESTHSFLPDQDDFIVVDADSREDLPGGSKLPNKFYFYIDKSGKYYYNKNNDRKYLPTNSWDVVFRR